MLPEPVVGIGKEARCLDLWQSPPDMEQDHLLWTKEHWIVWGCILDAKLSVLYLLIVKETGESVPRLTDVPVLSCWDPKV